MKRTQQRKVFFFIFSLLGSVCYCVSLSLALRVLFFNLAFHPHCGNRRNIQSLKSLLDDINTDSTGTPFSNAHSHFQRGLRAKKSHVNDKQKARDKEKQVISFCRVLSKMLSDAYNLSQWQQQAHRLMVRSCPEFPITLQIV